MALSLEEFKTLLETYHDAVRQVAFVEGAYDCDPRYCDPVDDWLEEEARLAVEQAYTAAISSPTKED